MEEEEQGDGNQGVSKAVPARGAPGLDILLMMVINISNKSQSQNLIVRMCVGTRTYINYADTFILKTKKILKMCSVYLITNIKYNISIQK